jgi:hypothetical protein
MKRNMIGALTILVVALAITVPMVNAESKAKADVPFAFTVSQSSLPTGTYTITVLNSNEIQIRNDQTNKTVFVIAMREESVKPQTPRLTFHKYGDRYFLAEAWCGSGTGIEIPASEMEREMRAAAKDAGGPSEVVVALR